MKLLIEMSDEDYYDLIEKSKRYPIDMFTKAQSSIIRGTPFPIHFAEDITKEIDERSVVSVPENCITGEKYEEWLYEKEPCEDAVSREDIKKIAKEMCLEVGNMELDVHTISDCISYTASKCRQVLVDKLNNLPPVTPKPLDLILEKIKAEITDKSYLSYDDNPRHIIDESWVLDIIDKHRKGSDGK